MDGRRFYYAARFGQVEVMRELVRHGATVPESNSVLERVNNQMYWWIEYWRLSEARRVSILRILLREGGRQVTSLASQVLQVAAENDRQPEFRMLAAAALAGRIG